MTPVIRFLANHDYTIMWILISGSIGIVGFKIGERCQLVRNVRTLDKLARFVRRYDAPEVEETLHDARKPGGFYQ
jgi:hypothetical protein